MSLLSVKLCKQDCGVFVTEVSVGKVSKLISWVNFFPCKSQQAANIRSSRCYSVPELTQQQQQPLIYMKISPIIALILQLVKVDKMRTVGEFLWGGRLDSRQPAASPKLVIYLSGLCKQECRRLCVQGWEGEIKRETEWEGDGIQRGWGFKFDISLFVSFIVFYFLLCALF